METAFLIIGAILATYGWYWGGVTESRTTAYAMGMGSFLLGLAFAFNGTDSVVLDALYAGGAIFGFLATANAWNESAQDRTYGMFALLFGVIAFFGFTYLTDNNFDGQFSIGVLALALTLVLHFISASLVPSNRGFKAFVGWVTLIAGVMLVYFAFADAIGAGIDPL